MISDEEFQARVKARADATGVSVEQAARNFEANLPALRKALGMRTMAEFTEGAQANMHRFADLWFSIDNYNRQLAENAKEGQNGAQDQ